MGASLTPADLDRLMAAMGSDDGREIVLVVLAAPDREDHSPATRLRAADEDLALARRRMDEFDPVRMRT